MKERKKIRRCLKQQSKHDKKTEIQPPFTSLLFTTLVANQTFVRYICKSTSACCTLRVSHTHGLNSCIHATHEISKELALPSILIDDTHCLTSTAQTHIRDHSNPTK